MTQVLLLQLENGRKIRGDLPQLITTNFPIGEETKIASNVRIRQVCGFAIEEEPLVVDEGDSEEQFHYVIERLMPDPPPAAKPPAIVQPLSIRLWDGTEIRGGYPLWVSSNFKLPEDTEVPPHLRIREMPECPPGEEVVLITAGGSGDRFHYLFELATDEPSREMVVERDKSGEIIRAVTRPLPRRIEPLAPPYQRCSAGFVVDAGSLHRSELMRRVERQR